LEKRGESERRPSACRTLPLTNCAWIKPIAPRKQKHWSTPPLPNRKGKQKARSPGKNPGKYTWIKRRTRSWWQSQKPTQGVFTRSSHKAKLLAIGHFFIMSLPKKIGLDEGREACRKSKSTHQNDIEVVRIKKGTERPGRRSTRPRCKIENKVREGGKQKL
jgi:hypothetical protein